MVSEINMLVTISVSLTVVVASAAKLATPLHQLEPQNDYTKYSHLFRSITRKCVIHFSIGLIDDQDIYRMSHRFLEICINSGKGCINLVTSNYTEPRQLFRNMKKAIYDLKSIPRLSTIYLAELPFIQELEDVDVSSQPRLIYNESTLIGLRVLPGYILIPTNSKIDLFPLPPSFSTKVLFFRRSKPEIYIACMTCFNVIYNYFSQLWFGMYFVENRKIFSRVVITTAPLVPIDLTVTRKIEDVDEYWERLHYTLNIDKFYGYNFPIAEPELATLSSHNLFLNIIKNKHNCTTWETCRSYLRHIFFKFSGDPFGWYFPFPYGVTFETYRYSIFLNNDELDRAKFSFDTFISPFTTIGWLYVILSVSCTAVVLRLSGFKNGSFVWTATVLIEQGETDEGKKNKKIMLLFTMWMFASILIRNVYISSLYYYMTVIQSPKNLPNSFDNLLYEHNEIVRVFDRLTSQSLLQQRNRMRTSGAYAYHGRSVKRLEQTTEKFVILRTVGLYRDDGTDNDLIKSDLDDFFISTSHFSLASFLNKLKNVESIYQCEKFLKFMTDRNNEGNYGEVLVNHKITLMERTLGRFALLIRNTNFQNWYQEEHMTTNSMEIVIALFGGRKLITNNETPVLVQPILFWNTVTKHFFSGNFQKILSSVIESGIYQRFEDYTDIKDILHMIKSVSRNVMGGQLHWSFYNVASNLTHRKIDRIVEEGSESLSGTMVEELDMVWCLHIFLCLVSGFVLSMEMMWPWVNKSEFGFAEW
ncbi:unnamed protein product [Orchesella dallaii]|uniref:Uncharacterized protein n=1 Tax=Orchesella dallaii TaxID=48710 RepID=A0ABP1RHZ4_9HEXA